MECARRSRLIGYRIVSPPRLCRSCPATCLTVRPVAVDLSDNCNLWGAHPAALEVLNQLGAQAASRYPGSYSGGLAEALAVRYGFDTDTVVTGVGATGVLDTLMRAVAPTTVRVLDPGWPAAGMLATMNGHTPVPVPWSAGGG